MRSLNDEERVGPLHKLCPDSKHPLELVEADLYDDVCWKSAVQGKNLGSPESGGKMNSDFNKKA